MCWKASTESSTGSAEKVVENGPRTRGGGPFLGLFPALTKLLCKGAKSLKTIHFDLLSSFAMSRAAARGEVFHRKAGEIPVKVLLTLCDAGIYPLRRVCEAVISSGRFLQECCKKEALAEGRRVIIA
jgi:hypothetical protein